jgi:hypothetical protein
MKTMLNPKTGERELCYIVVIDDITPIEGYDRVELANVGGWTIVVGKGEFQVSDPAIYFEIDSKLPEVEPFTNMEFLAKKKYKIKTQKMCKSLSQGLLMSAANFGWTTFNKVTYLEKGIENCPYPGILDDNNIPHFANGESRFLTKQLGVTYAEAEDNIRKAASADKYKKMAQRHGKLFSKQPFRWLMRREWGKKLLFIFFGKKRDKNGWPAWVKKTDEERIQNMPWILKDKEPWIATEKIDGTSTTFTLKRGKWPHKDEFYVCSRNVCFNKPDKTCFYETNVYIEMAEKYDIYNKMTKMLNNDFADCEWITIKGETYGPGVQKRDYHAPAHDFMAFNFITSKDGRWGTEEMTDFLLKKNGIPCVPILDNNYILPDTVEELLNYATGESVCDHDLREGIVFRSKDGSKSFKAVSNEFLLKYHQ